MIEGSTEWPAEAGPAFEEIVVIGGGCYGAFYAGQLVRAKASGKVAYEQMIIVDRNPECRVVHEIGRAHV